MALPPERISIKRRRQEEPVDTLILEDTRSHDKKRRFTDFIFQRLRSDQPTQQQSTVEPPDSQPAVTSIPHDASLSRQVLGIPTVRSTTPGDEITDFARHKKAHQAWKQQHHTRPEESAQVLKVSSSLSDKHEPAKHTLRVARATRRFHLTRDLSYNLRPNQQSGIRRRKLNIRPPLATFVERRTNKLDSTSGSVSARKPVDSIVHIDESDVAAAISRNQPIDGLDSTQTPLNTFTKPSLPAIRSGHSIYDDPRTWDLDSDQLADQLAQLALELDPELADQQLVNPVPVPAAMDPMAVDGVDDYVFETYIRVRHGNDSSSIDSDIGILVIDEGDEDLWEKYVQGLDDDDEEWDDDDEDSNAEDNPRNDYPEDEVSSDDDFGRNVYKYRHDASDDEERNARGTRW